MALNEYDVDEQHKILPDKSDFIEVVHVGGNCYGVRRTVDRLRGLGYRVVDYPEWESPKYLTAKLYLPKTT